MLCSSKLHKNTHEMYLKKVEKSIKKHMKDTCEKKHMGKKNI